MRLFFFSFILCIVISGCNLKEDNPPSTKKSPDDYTESLIELNRQDLATEEEQISDYLRRYGWEMTRTGTGLRYMIYSKGKGIQAENGMKVKIRYTASLLNGIECYNSEKDGPMEFILGAGDEINGLEEGILYMKEGDKAKLIVPSHLGYGLPGDMNKIPRKSTLVFDIEILELENI